MIREFTCVSCPIGCSLRVEQQQDGSLKISGNRCPRGETYAREEVIDPKRVLATNVKVIGGTYPLVSVRTDRPVPKRLIPEIMNLVRNIEVLAPVQLGQVIAENLLGTGAKLIATRTVPALSSQTSQTPFQVGTARPR